MKQLLTIGLVLLAVPALGAETADRIVAVINDEIVFDTEVDQLAATQLRGPPDLESAEGKKAFAQIKRKALDHLIDQKLVGMQAQELKLTVNQEEVDRALDSVMQQNNLTKEQFVEALKQQGFTLDSYRKTLKKQILELKVINTAVRSRVQISDDEVRTFYNQNARQMGAGTNAHLRQILLTVPADAPAALVEQKRKLAVSLVEQARTGKVTFEELAKKHSEDEATKGDGGDLGWIEAGGLVEALETEITNMDKGDVRGPIRTARGWHVLQLVERKASQIRPFDEAKDAIRKQLYDQQIEKATQSWIKELRKKAHVDVRL
jgi:peptidyl-prolyl cis-trans isomerase SurA